ncbi:hypothetical protein AVEN_202307-1 [Araneus ventricosus]|uniref:Uncharacterized protein n=1 Tax=Araneus ventricosus TaxID=182803 RepID=A0A4Y2JR83_ARAVE|nr:hypothetical protein AVEN_202307-1 [Araneus ventricosus]
MASMPHGYPNILVDTELLLIVAAAMMVRATRYMSESAGVSYIMVFKEPEKRNQEEINRGICEWTTYLNPSACKQPVSCIGTVKDSCSDRFLCTRENIW